MAAFTVSQAGGYIVKQYTSQGNMKWKYQLSCLKKDGRKEEYTGTEYIE